MGYRGATVGVVWAVAAAAAAPTSGVATVVRVGALVAVVHVGDGAAVGDAVGDGAGVKVVVGEVQVLEILEVAEFGGDFPGEAVGLEVERLQLAVAGDSGGDGVLEVAVVDGDRRQAIRERAPLRRDLGAELEVLQLQRLQVLELVQRVARSA